MYNIHSKDNGKWEFNKKNIHPTEQPKLKKHSCDLCSPKAKQTEDNLDWYDKLNKAIADAIHNEDIRWDLYELTDELINIMVSKHSDYGTNNISTSPGGAINGLAVRLHDKVNRITNLLSNSKSPNNESIRDTFIDIANYAMIALLVIDDKWDSK